MLDLNRTSPINLNYSAVDPRGFEMELKIPRWGKEGVIVDDDLVYDVSISKIGSTLMLGDELIADATGAGSRWQIATADEVFVIDQPSWAKNLSGISKDGALIGKLEETSRIRGRVTCDIPDEIHPVVQAYIAFLGIFGWQQVSRSVTSGSGAGSGP